MVRILFHFADKHCVFAIYNCLIFLLIPIKTRIFGIMPRYKQYKPEPGSSDLQKNMHRNVLCRFVLLLVLVMLPEC